VTPIEPLPTGGALILCGNRSEEERHCLARAEFVQDGFAARPARAQLGNPVADGLPVLSRLGGIPHDRASRNQRQSDPGEHDPPFRHVTKPERLNRGLRANNIYCSYPDGIRQFVQTIRWRRPKVLDSNPVRGSIIGVEYDGAGFVRHRFELKEKLV
jgi:hypothetical protein